MHVPVATALFYLFCLYSGQTFPVVVSFSSAPRACLCSCQPMFDSCLSPSLSFALSVCAILVFAPPLYVFQCNCKLQLQLQTRSPLRKEPGPISTARIPSALLRPSGQSFNLFIPFCIPVACVGRQTCFCCMGLASSFLLGPGVRFFVLSPLVVLWCLWVSFRLWGASPSASLFLLANRQNGPLQKGPPKDQKTTTTTASQAQTLPTHPFTFFSF